MLCKMLVRPSQTHNPSYSSILYLRAVLRFNGLTQFESGTKPVISVDGKNLFTNQLDWPSLRLKTLDDPLLPYNK